MEKTRTKGKQASIQTTFNLRILLSCFTVGCLDHIIYLKDRIGDALLIPYLKLVLNVLGRLKKHPLYVRTAPVGNMAGARLAKA